MRPSLPLCFATDSPTLTKTLSRRPWKGGFLRDAAEEGASPLIPFLLFPLELTRRSLAGIALVFPDTSPRGADVDGEDKDWDFGTSLLALDSPRKQRPELTRAPPTRRHGRRLLPDGEQGAVEEALQHVRLALARPSLAARVRRTRRARASLGAVVDCGGTAHPCRPARRTSLRGTRQRTPSN